MNHKLFLAAKIFVSSALLYYLISNIGLHAVAATVQQITWWHAAVVLISSIIIMLIGTYNMYLLLKAVSCSLPFIRLLRYYLVSWSLGLFVPGKLGEFSIVYFFRKEGIPLGVGSAVALIDKLITFSVLSLITLYGVFLFFREQFTVFIVALIGLFLCGAFVVSPLGRAIIRRYILRRYHANFKGLSHHFFLLLRQHSSVLLLNAVLTLFKWFLSAYAFYLILRFFQPQATFVHTFIIICTSIIVSLIPLSISGLGLREGITVYLFSRVGVAQEYTISVSLLFTLMGYGIALLVLLFLLHNLKLGKRNNKPASSL